MLVYGLLKQFGKDGLEKIAANAVRLRLPAPPTRAWRRAEIPGLTIEYARRNTWPVVEDQAGLPAEGSYLAPEGMFIVKGAKKPGCSQTMYSTLMSKEVPAELCELPPPYPHRHSSLQLTTLPDLKSIKIFPPLNQEARFRRVRAARGAVEYRGQQGIDLAPNVLKRHRPARNHFGCLRAFFMVFLRQATLSGCEDRLKAPLQDVIKHLRHLRRRIIANAQRRSLVARQIRKQLFHRRRDVTQ